MNITATNLEGCYILEPIKYGDSRGYFFESFNEQSFEKLTGFSTHFVQDNQSFSTYGVLRGLHAQTGEYAQAKLVRVLEGRVMDVVVDARPQSATFGQHQAFELSSDNNLQLFIPRGFLHGFVVLSETATFFYKCDNFYNKDSECGIKFDDPVLGINWGLPADALIISEKDAILPTFQEVFGKWYQ